MGKKKEVQHKAKDKSKIDERVKKILSIQPPEQNEWKMDNEHQIERFWRFGLSKSRYEGSIRDQRRKKKKERRYI